MSTIIGKMWKLSLKYDNECGKNLHIYSKIENQMLPLFLFNLTTKNVDKCDFGDIIYSTFEAIKVMIADGFKSTVSKIL